MLRHLGKWRSWVFFGALAVITGVSVFEARSRADAGEDPLSIQPELLAAAPQVPDFKIENPHALEWKDEDNPERELWTDYMFKVINSTFNDLDQVQDMDQFCPNYPKLTRDQKIQTWAQLFTEIAYWESSFDPTNDTLETGPSAGHDNVTNDRVHSDGLLQLSYEDILETQKWSGNDCKFDFKADQKLPENDVHRTIYNPYINLYCGIHIMAAQIAQKHTIILGEDAYWATLQTGNFLENRVHEMRHMMRHLEWCGVKRHILGDIKYDVMRLIRSIHE